MKKTEAMSVGEIIDKAIASTGNRDEYNRQQAAYLWAEVVGPTIGRYTTRRWVDRDTLHVCITSASMKNELLYRIPELVNAINSALGTSVLSTIIIH